MSLVSRTTRSQRWLWLLPAAALVAAFHFTSFAGPALDRAFLDTASRHPMWRSPVPANSALVLIDEDTLAEEGHLGFRWPFPRNLMAQLILAVHQAGARHVLVDVTFFEETEQDPFLAAVAAATRTVVLARDSTHEPVFWPKEFVAANPSYFLHPRTGLVDFRLDADGVARHYRVPGSLAAAAFDAAPAVRGGLVRWHGGLEEIRQLPGKPVPLVSAASLIRAGEPLAQRVAAAADDMDLNKVAAALAKEPALTGPVADRLRGRTVFIGASASSTYDLKAFPVGQIEPAVLLHWTAWTNLVSDGFITELPGWGSLLVGALAGFAIVAASTRWPGLPAPTVVAACFVAIFVPSAYAALAAGWYFPPSTPVMAAGLTLLGVVAENYWTEQRRKREIQTMFGAYVDKGVVEQLVRDPGSIRLRGERREATVFFSDLVGFTDLSEKLKDRPEEMLEIVNAYLDETSECLMNHGAYVDKYIGDAVMAVFGVPQSLPDHALAACRGALEARDALVRVNARYAEKVGVTLSVRIGLNSGSMLVGNVGSSRKKNYTVMGDTVNLASRLEGANKEFHTQILIGETTAEAVAGRMATRPLTRLQVKGKHEAVEVHELIAQPEHLTPEQRDFLAAYLPGYGHYTTRRFTEAAADFRRALAVRPDDDVTQELLRQAEAFAVHPPPGGWQPILTLKTK